MDILVRTLGQVDHADNTYHMIEQLVWAKEA